MQQRGNHRVLMAMAASVLAAVFGGGDDLTEAVARSFRTAEQKKDAPSAALGGLSDALSDAVGAAAASGVLAGRPASHRPAERSNRADAARTDAARTPPPSWPRRRDEARATAPSAQAGVCPAPRGALVAHGGLGAAPRLHEPTPSLFPTPAC